MIIFPGTNPVTTWVSFTFVSGYGLWPSPVEAEGADQRSAANLMVAVESLTDRTNLLGWRVSLLNPVDGSAGNSSLTATITNWNGWQFKRFVTIMPGATFNLFGTGIIGDATGGLATLYVGKTGSGVGHVIVGPDSDITANGTSGHRGKIIIDAFGNIDVLSGGLLETEIGSGTNLKGITQQFGLLRRSGIGAFTQNRTSLITAGTIVTLDGAEGDIFTIPATLSGVMTIRIATNLAAAGHRFVIRQGGNTPGFTTTVENATGTRQIGIFYDATAQGGVPSNEYIGAIEYYYNANGAPTPMFVNTGVDDTNGNVLAGIN